jgi:plastocyanin
MRARCGFSTSVCAQIRMSRAATADKLGFIQCAAFLAEERPIMEPEQTDQQAFDEQVNTTGKLVLQILAGVGVFAALIMSLAALLVSSDKHMSTVPAQPAVASPVRASLPAPTQVMIEHVTRGCHSLAVNGARPSPNATLRVAVGGRMVVQNNDVMPHRLIAGSGPPLRLKHAMMSHMGASSTVTFTTPGVYHLTTKAGEDYMKGITTVGADNTLRIKVVVS